jgi:hypothetical protein
MLAPHPPNMRVASELRPKSKKRKTNPPKQTIRAASCASLTERTQTRIRTPAEYPRFCVTALPAKPQLQRNKRHKRPIYAPRPSAILRHPRLSYYLHATTLRRPDYPRFCVTLAQGETATTTKQTAQALDLRPTSIHDFASPLPFLRPATYDLRSTTYLPPPTTYLPPPTTLYNGYRT